MKFINRQIEFNTLENEYNSKDSSFVVIYGRRRVGKTSLINKFLESHEENIYFLATQEPEKQNIEEFKKTVAQYSDNQLLEAAQVGWIDIFKEFVKKATPNKKIIVIDEFQYLCIGNPAFPSIMQKIWDTILKDSNVMLIVCGSLINLMKSQVLDYSSPLYGRRTSQIKLKQISFKHYKEFYPDFNEKDLIPFYAVTGGVPKYIETFQGYTDIYDAIKNKVLDPQSYLYEEPYFLLQKEVTEIGSYFSLIKAIAMGNRKLSQISSVLGVVQTSLTKYLKVLIDLDLVEREVPVTEKSPEKSKSGLYKITDNFIAFWFKFVYPYLSYLERKEQDYVINIIKERFIQNYVSFVYEDVCREKMWEYSSQQMWDFKFDKVGRYWGSLAGEIDIVAIDTEGKNLVLGECKYSKTEKGLSVLHELQEKATAIKKLTESKYVEYIIFSNSGFTDSLIEEAKNNQNIKLIKDL